MFGRCLTHRGCEQDMGKTPECVSRAVSCVLLHLQPEMGSRQGWRAEPSTAC